MKVKEAFALTSMVLILMSTFSLLTAPTKATEDVHAYATISIRDVQACSTIATLDVYPCATILPSGSGFQLSSNGSSPTFNEQLGLTFVQNFTSITYDVKAWHNKIITTMDQRIW